MAAITSITENWSGHSFKEVETHIKGSYLPLTSVSVGSISSGVANVLTLNSSNAVKKTSLSDLASLLGVGGDYLPLTGGTITGNLTVNGTGHFSDTCTAQSIEFGHNNEINSISSNQNLHLNYRASGAVTICNGGGYCCIGKSEPSYKLDVAGAVGATSFVNTSDIRKKDIIENFNLNVETIANAPIFKFTWIDQEMSEGVNVGTSAQYWQSILPQVVHIGNDEKKTLSMQYDVAALVSVVSLAREVQKLKEQIKGD